MRRAMGLELLDGVRVTLHLGLDGESISFDVPLFMTEATSSARAGPY